MSRAYLLTGGNIGDRLKFLEEAVKLIQQQCGQIVQRSSVYETAPWGITDQPSFYNQALKIETLLSPENLMQSLLHIEEKMGRKRNIKLGPRIIDIDILLMDDFIIDNNFLTVPHPHLTERKFALTPLAEIAGGIIHPIEKKTIAQLLTECKDLSDVYKISEYN